MKGFFLVGALVLLFIAYPFLVVWALNTLFGLEIVFNMWTWMAVLILSGVFGLRVSK